ncbi:GntR family transcriptional regulator [Cloacibacillus sp. An23]|uniref:FadR/GntR family transcriptional regulator n=1 Tax=Cloacibacillus sp. An23 TaxID=1965591 RepID=UPI0013023F1D|nr:GntR family transcriptional regulator [Cloacibacillus sp. An23]
MTLKREGTLSQLVLESIQDSIRSGEFRPGEALPSERELAERYGVGKSSIREAVKMLQILGVVETSQGRGTYLRRASGPSLLNRLLPGLARAGGDDEELCEFRLFFDLAYIRLAAARATDEHRTRAREAFDGLSRTRRESPSEAAGYDMEFHRAMLEATGNVFIVEAGLTIAELCRPRADAEGGPYRDEAVESLGRILEMFCSGDTEGLEDEVVRALGSPARGSKEQRRRKGKTDEDQED